jgi:hypothetical protein
LKIDPEPRRLRWLLALLPGCILVNHVVYLLFSRRKQFSEALAPGDASKALADLYFARGPLLVRYLLPAIVATVLCSTAIAALTTPREYVSWLWAPASVNAAAPLVKTDGSSTANTPAAGEWPADKTWGREVLRGAALGFVGAYVYILLLLTERARQRDITSGLAVWVAAMPVLGPLMGGVAALLLASGAGSTADGSFTRDAVFFVAGMLPQQFAAFAQSGVRRLFQSGGAASIRTMPLTLLRGVGAEVEARLQEEGIHDVSALAYASPYALIRTTTYAPKQVADWIDEALLLATVPNHWDALEKVGVTGAMDLAWYRGKAAAIKVLAGEVKMNEVLLDNVVERLDLDAQVADLRKLYWDGELKVREGVPAAPVPDESESKYRFLEGFTQEARDRLTAEICNIDGVKTVTVAGDSLTVVVSSDRREAVAEALRGKKEIAPEGVAN